MRRCVICARPLDGLIQRRYCLACRPIADDWRQAQDARGGTQTVRGQAVTLLLVGSTPTRPSRSRSRDD